MSAADAETKLAAFGAGTLRAARDIAGPEAAALGIRMHRSGLGNVICEPNAMLASSRPTKRDPAFVGQHSYMNDGGYLRGPVFVGRYCSIGRRVSIGAAAHTFEGLSTSPVTWRNGGSPYTQAERDRLFGTAPRAQAGATLIGNDVWIGDGAVVLAGVSIGSGAVVGANAVVTGDVEPYAVVAGLPARCIRMRFPADVVAALLATRWWNLAPQALGALPTGHVLRFLEQVGSAPVARAGIESLRVLA